jgi:transposase
VVVAAIIVQQADGTWLEAKRTFGTMTADLLELSDWLMAQGVTHVAMESTGDYWKPVFNILENSFEVMVVNAQHISKVPGRKTDQAMDTMELMQWPVEGHFIPPLGQRIER